VTESNQRIAANMLLVSAGAAAAYIIVTKPPLRRLAGRMSRFWLAFWASTYVADQVLQAWLEAARPARQTMTSIARAGAPIADGGQGERRGEQP
jgi:hypothetical protein